MSQTFLQHFYQSAIEKGEFPVLGFNRDKEFHWIPRWILRSKAKHFALGLIQEGAEPGEYFYIFNDIHPNGIYAELAALTLGLQTLSLPLEMEAGAIAHLLQRYPAALVFFEKQPTDPVLQIFQRKKGIKFILPEKNIGKGKESHLTFRKIFNQGIMQETTHYQKYREFRDSVEFSSNLSPIQIDNTGNIFHQPLKYSQVHGVFAKLTKIYGEKAPNCILVQADFSRTLDRILGLYWPLYSGARSLLDPRLPRLPSPHLARKNPQLVYLTEDSLVKLTQSLAMPSRAPQNWWTRLWLRHRLKRLLGSKIQEIWLTQKPKLKQLDFWKTSPIPLRCLDHLQPPNLGNIGEN